MAQRVTAGRSRHRQILMSVLLFIPFGLLALAILFFEGRSANGGSTPENLAKGPSDGERDNNGGDRAQVSAQNTEETPQGRMSVLGQVNSASNITLNTLTSAEGDERSKTARAVPEPVFLGPITDRDDGTIIDTKREYPPRETLKGTGRVMETDLAQDSDDTEPFGRTLTDGDMSMAGGFDRGLLDDGTGRSLTDGDGNDTGGFDRALLIDETSEGRTDEVGSETETAIVESEISEEEEQTAIAMRDDEQREELPSEEERLSARGAVTGRSDEGAQRATSMVERTTEPGETVQLAERSADERAIAPDWPTPEDSVETYVMEPGANREVRIERPGERQTAFVIPDPQTATEMIVVPAPGADEEVVVDVASLDVPRSVIPAPAPMPQPAPPPPPGPEEFIIAGAPWVVQLIAVEDEAVLCEYWADLKIKHPKLFGEAERTIARKVMTDGRIIFRLRAGSFRTREQAADYCEAIGEFGQACYPIARGS